MLLLAIQCYFKIIPFLAESYYVSAFMDLSMLHATVDYLKVPTNVDTAHVQR